VPELDPGFVPALFSLASALSQQGECEEAIGLARKAVEFTGGHVLIVAHLANMYAAAGRRAEALAEIEGILSGGREPLPYALSLVYSRLGERERALDLLAEAFGQGNTHLHDLNVDPERADLLRGALGRDEGVGRAAQGTAAGDEGGSRARQRAGREATRRR
jgi:tetratricopeptide (TPR) repeat protein